MPLPTTMEFIPVLQTAIGPVVLMSGVGLFLLTMTNRLGRVIDRSRVLAGLPRSELREAQLAILWWRARLLRVSIVLVIASALAACSLIVLIFVVALWHLDITWALALLFSLCLGCLMAALVPFAMEVHNSLLALRLEVGAPDRA